jgi:hypothetical protein
MALKPVDYLAQFLSGFAQSYVKERGEEKRLERQLQREDEQQRKQLRTSILSGQYNLGNVSAQAGLEKLTGESLPEPMQQYRKPDVQDRIVTIGENDPILKYYPAFKPNDQVTQKDYADMVTGMNRGQSTERRSSAYITGLYGASKKTEIAAAINAKKAELDAVKAMIESNKEYGMTKDYGLDHQLRGKLADIQSDLDGLYELSYNKSGGIVTPKEQPGVVDDIGVPGAVRVQ